jgi:hypothetical protein
LVRRGAKSCKICTNDLLFLIGFFFQNIKIIILQTPFPTQVLPPSVHPILNEIEKKQMLKYLEVKTSSQCRQVSRDFLRSRRDFGLDDIVESFSGNPVSSGTSLVTGSLPLNITENGDWNPS